MASLGNRLPVPAALTRGVDFRVIDYNELEITMEAAADGVAAQSTDYLQQDQWLRVERIVAISDTQATGVELTVYKGDLPVLPQRGRDWTPMPPGFVAVAEYPAFLTVYPGSCLTLQAAGANSGDLFWLAVQYQLVAKVLRS